MGRNSSSKQFGTDTPACLDPNPLITILAFFCIETARIRSLMNIFSFKGFLPKFPPFFHNDFIFCPAVLGDNLNNFSDFLFFNNSSDFSHLRTLSDEFVPPPVVMGGNGSSVCIWAAWKQASF